MTEGGSDDRAYLERLFVQPDDDAGGSLLHTSLNGPGRVLTSEELVEAFEKLRREGPRRSDYEAWLMRRIREGDA